MKKLSKEEAAEYMYLKSGRTTYVRSQLMLLETGEALIIEKGIDWVSKTPPYRVINSFSKKSGRKFEFGRRPDGKGWFVKRVG